MMHSTLQWAIISISKQDGRKLFNLYVGVIIEKRVSSGAGILLRVVQSSPSRICVESGSP